MRLGGNAKYLSAADSEDDVVELVAWAKNNNLKFIVIGQGSNIVWNDSGFEGLVIVDKIMGREIVNENSETATLKVAGGEEWDKIVEWTVGKGLSGFEFLSLIPGTVGATPVQNIGAYGAEIADSLISVRALDTASMIFVDIPKNECEFGYRTSRFKTTDKDKFIITAITVKLQKKNPAPPFYEALQKYLDDNNQHNYTPATIRQAVIAIRTSKLPDPKLVANNGSFFTNPIISSEQFKNLKEKYPEIKGWPYNGKVKVAAGWLVEQAGFKDFHDQQTGMATYGKQALVLVNEHAKSTVDLLQFKQKIIDKVQDMFGLTLEQEPELIG